jgi:DNA polymerase-3 subunit epsilon
MRHRRHRDLLRRPWDEVGYWALDLEMTGLDTRHDSIIAVGMVPVLHRAIRVGEGYATLVALGDGEPFSSAGVPAHQLLPSALAGAPALSDVVDAIEVRLRGAVLVVHAAGVDLPFLRKAFGDTGRSWPDPPVVDTVALLRRHERHPLAPVGATAGLAAARSRLGLPPHDAHNAFADAVATAELFLVLAHRLGARTAKDLVAGPWPLAGPLSRR